MIVTGSANFALSLFFYQLCTIILIAVGSIVCSCLISAAHLAASESAVIFNSVARMGTTLVLLAFSFDFVGVSTEFAKIK